MTSAAVLNTHTQEPFKSRQAMISGHPSVLADIYQEDINIAIWQRDLSNELNTSIKKLLDTQNNFEKSLIVTPMNIYSKLTNDDGPLQKSGALCQDVAELVDMFCLLYELQEVGLRLAILDRAMCPRFHVDRVPCRLTCTYHGVNTEWLPHNKVDRQKLGRGNNGLVDERSGLYSSAHDINQLKNGDVALLKGELWEGNENAGLVHRSPQVPQGEKRLLLTLDFI